MRKFLTALLIVSGLLMLSASALADLACERCGNTNLGWFGYVTESGEEWHARFCRAPCYLSVFGTEERCTPLEGSATCVYPEICSVCRSYLYSTQPDPDAHDWSVSYQWNANYSECVATRRCGHNLAHNQSETVAAQVSVTPSTCTAEGSMVYTASFAAEWAQTQKVERVLPLAQHTEVTDKAVAPGCTREGLTEGSHCGECGMTLKEQTPVSARGHRFEEVIKAPLCHREGVISEVCTVCGYSYVTGKTDALLHWFDEWTPNADGTHSAPCRREGCGYTGTSACAPLEAVLPDGSVLMVCPVCGEAGADVFETIEQAEIFPAGKKMLPVGEAVVRGKEAPCEGVLLAFTAAWEYSGEVIPFGTTVTVSLPLSAEQFDSFEMVRVDAVPADETAERTGSYTAVKFAFENGVLTVEADSAGLYLIVPKK